MKYLLDTCVISEFTRRIPEDKVIQWIEGIDEDQLFLSVITIGEIQRGIERLPDSRRKIEMQAWVNNQLIQRFNNRVISLDTQTMLIWGSLTARMESAGVPLPLIDSLIIATALQHTMVIVTRNISDFGNRGVQIINPWQ